VVPCVVLMLADNCNDDGEPRYTARSFGYWAKEGLFLRVIALSWR
jgi:hypothetical protein